MAMGKGIKTQVKLNFRRLMLPVLFDDNNKYNVILLTYFFKIQIDNKQRNHFSTGICLCLSVPKGNLN